MEGSPRCTGLKWSFFTQVALHATYNLFSMMVGGRITMSHVIDGEGGNASLNEGYHIPRGLKMKDALNELKHPKMLKYLMWFFTMVLQDSAKTHHKFSVERKKFWKNWNQIWQFCNVHIPHYLIREGYMDGMNNFSCVGGYFHLMEGVGC